MLLMTRDRCKHRCGSAMCTQRKAGGEKRTRDHHKLPVLVGAWIRDEAVGWPLVYTRFYVCRCDNARCEGEPDYRPVANVDHSSGRQGLPCGLTFALS
jgi:hypothetical protein